MRRSPTRWRWAAVLLALSCAGCPGNGGNGDVAPPPDVRPESTEVPREVLEHDLEATVMENYAHVTLGNFSAFRDGLAGDLSAVLFGVTSDVVVGIRPRDAGRDRRLYPMLGPTLLAKNLEVDLADDGSVGWVFDEMSYRVPYGGRVASIPIRNTGLFVRDFDRWVLVHEHHSYAMGIDDLRSMAAAGTLESPRPFRSQVHAAPAKEILALVRLLHNAAPGAPLPIAAGDETLVLLPDREHELRGGDTQTAPSLATLFGPGTTVDVRDYRIGMAKNTKVAWMAANLVVRTVVNDDPVDLGLRGTYVLVLGEGGWHVVQMHVSAPISERELSRRTFGTP